MCIEYRVQVNMYHVSAQGVDERIIIIIKCADLISIISLSYDKPTTKKSAGDANTKVLPIGQFPEQLVIKSYSAGDQTYSTYSALTTGQKLSQ